MDETANDTFNIAAILLYTAKGEFVLQRRDGGAPTAANKLCMFGGHMKLGERPLEAVRRELSEEVSAKIAPEYFTVFHQYNEPDGANRPVDFYIFVAPLSERHFKVLEGKSAEWIPFGEAANRTDLVSGTRDAIQLFLKEKAHGIINN
jgi:8-oxo-dGTP pyrophosphatase MutT (NUDIX family)